MLILGKNVGSPNLHLCSLLRSWDGSCYKVKITAVILGEPAQTDNSWHKQMWPTENSSGSAGAIPVQVFFSSTNSGCFSSVYAAPWVSCCYRWVQSSKNQTGLNLSSPLLFQWLFPNNMTLKEKYLLYGENFLYQGPYAMPGGCNNSIYGATTLFMH